MFQAIGVVVDVVKRDEAPGIAERLIHFSRKNDKKQTLTISIGA